MNNYILLYFMTVPLAILSCFATVRIGKHHIFFNQALVSCTVLPTVSNAAQISLSSFPSCAAKSILARVIVRALQIPFLIRVFTPCNSFSVRYTLYLSWGDRFILYHPLSRLKEYGIVMCEFHKKVLLGAIFGILFDCFGRINDFTILAVFSHNFFET